MPHSQVTTIIVTWNSRQFIYDALESIVRQSAPVHSVIVIDNASTDGTVDFIRQRYPQVYILQNFKNVGFAKANNQGIKLAKTPFVLLMNPDIILDPHFIERLMAGAETQFEAGSFTGLVLKLRSKHIDLEEKQADLKNYEFTDIVDTAGLRLDCSRVAKNTHEWCQAANSYAKTKEIFGVSGCCALYRKEALEDVKIFDEYFDEDFFAYKEDVDLAWRLRLYGWKSFIIPSALAYHVRNVPAPQKRNLFAIVRTRQKVSERLKVLSYINHRLMVVKNELLPNLTRDFFLIAVRELGVLAYLAIFETSILWQGRKVFGLLPRMLRKRKLIMSRRESTPRAMHAWFKAKP